MTDNRRARRGRWWVASAAALLLALLGVAAVAVVRCALAPGAVRFGPYFVVGPSCDPARASMVLELPAKAPGQPEAQYWRCDDEALTGTEIACAGRFTVYRTSGSLPAPFFQR